MEIRVGPSEKRLVAPGVVPMAPDEVEWRRAKDGVSEAEVIAAVRDNGRDELVVRGDDGKVYVASASKLDVEWRWGFPKAGERVTAGEVSGTVVYADDETNVAHIVARVGTGAMFTLAPLLGFKYAEWAIVHADSVVEGIANFMALPFNAAIGTALSGLGIGLGSFLPAAIYDVVADEKRAAALDEVTETIDTAG